MADFITVRVRGEELAVRLRKIPGLPRDPKLLRGIGEIVREGIREHFRDQRGPDGKRWPAVRRPGQDDAKPLQDTRRLFNSFAIQVSGSRVRVGTNVRYARKQNDGGVITAPPGKMLTIPTTLRSKRLRRPLRGNPALAGFASIRLGKTIVLAKALRKRDRGKFDVWELSDGSRLDVAFILKHSIRIRQRRYMGVSQKTQSRTIRFAEGVARRALESGVRR